MTDMVLKIVLYFQVVKLEDGGMILVEPCGLMVNSEIFMEFTSMESGIHSNLWRSRFNQITAPIMQYTTSYLIIQLHTI